MFPIFLILFAIAGLCLSVFLILLLFSSPKKCRFAVNDDQSVEIVKFVDAHREIVPICSVQGWSLISSYCGLRCWKRDLSFTVAGSQVVVYGCSKIINCSAVIVLNVIADVSTWPEWDPLSEGQTVHLEVSEDPSLHGDLYMQCDQLVVTSTMVKSKPEIVMYRFGNLECNGVGWILLWSAKKLDWIFYVAQPLNHINNNGSDSSEEKCMLSAVWGFEDGEYETKDLPNYICSKVQNLSDAIDSSHYKVRPFLPMMQSHLPINNPHYPTIHSALSDLPEKPCVLLELEKAREINILQNCVLAVIPISSEKSGLNKIVGFTLTSRVLKKVLTSASTNTESLHSEEKRRSRRRQKTRSDSLTSCSPRIIKSLELEGRRSSSLSAPVRRRKPPEVTVTEVDSEPKMPSRAASHSFLDLIFHSRRSSDASEKKNKSPCESRSSTPPTSRKKKTKSSSASSQEDLSHIPVQHHTTASLSDASEHEISSTEKEAKRTSKCVQSNIKKDSVDSGSHFLNIKDEDIDYVHLGEYCISSLLKEIGKASLVDINTSEEEQSTVSGGWIFKELNKNVTVLKKTTILGECNVISHLCKGIIPSSCTIVWKTLCNPLTRFMYDDTVKKISVIAELPSKQKLIHMYNESITLLKKEIQDFCLLQTEKVEGKKMILAFHSVDEKLCPPMKDVVRGTIIASGWVIEEIPESPSVSMVSYLMQMVVSNSEIQLMEEISNTQSRCINNLSAYLATRPV